MSNNDYLRDYENDRCYKTVPLSDKELAFMESLPANTEQEQDRGMIARLTDIGFVECYAIATSDGRMLGHRLTRPGAVVLVTCRNLLAGNIRSAA